MCHNNETESQSQEWPNWLIQIGLQIGLQGKQAVYGKNTDTKILHGY